MSNESQTDAALETPNPIDALLSEMLNAAFQHGMAQQRVDDYRLALDEATNTAASHANDAMIAVTKFRTMLNVDKNEEVN